MKVVKEFINERFEDDSDPIKDMNIGKKNLILKDLVPIGIDDENNGRYKPSDIQFNDNMTFFMKAGRRQEPSGFYEIQLKHFPEPYKKLLKNLRETETPIENLIDTALEDGVEASDILPMIKYELENVYNRENRYHTAAEDKKKAEIYLHKVKRTSEKKKEDIENNIYVFIGFEDKKPVMVNGEKYYKDAFNTEAIIKIDKYNLGDLNMIGGMKMRAKVQYGNTHKGAVYFVTIPKDLMDEDRYEEIPDHMYDIFVKYKQRT